MPSRMKLDRETLGGLADMFGQMPGVFCSCIMYACALPFLFFVVRGHLKTSLFSQAVGLELARGLFRTGTRLLWDAIAPTHSSMATVATLPLHLSHSLTWGPSLLLSPTR